MPESNVMEPKVSPPRWLPTRVGAVKIALGYALLGALWIWGSGWLLHRYVADGPLEARLEQMKGWGFVAVTALLLGVALDRYFREIRRSARLLQESEQRWQFAVEGAEHGVWDWNVRTNEVFYSAGWKSMLGYQAHEVGSTLAEWETRVHAEDLARVLAEVRRHLEGQTPVYRSEHRVRCKDGSFKWILDQGKVMSRGPDGQPLRVMGTHSDITDRKRLADAQAFLAHTAERSEAFFRTLARYLAESLGMSYVCIDRLLEDQFTAVTVAVYDDGRFQDNVSYALKDTPCGEVVAGGVCCFPREVRRLFPKDTVLEDLRAESYLGTVLWGSGGRPIGLIALIGRQPLAKPELARAVLQLVSGRAAIELEHQHAEAALRRWADAFEHCAHGIAMGEPGSNRILTCNPALARMLGRPVQSVAGSAILSLYVPEDHDRIRACLAEADQVGQVRYETRMSRPDGSSFPVQMDVVSVRDAAGQVIYRIATAQDISERQQAGQALRQSERLYQSLVENMPQAIFRLDRLGRITFANSRYCQIRGRPLADLLGKTDADLFPPALAARYWADSRRVMTIGQAFETVEEHRAPDGTLSYLQVLKSPLRDATGEITGLQCLFWDVTARHSAECALRASLEEKTALLKEVHHRVKNNLQVVSSLLSLQARQGRNPLVLEALRDTQSRVRSMALLHETLYREGSVARVNCAFYLDHLCAHLAQSFGPVAGRVQIESHLAPIELELDQAIPCGLVVNELVSNAFKHAFPGQRQGRVRVDLQAEPDGQIVLTVADDGVGLPADLDPAETDTLGLQMVAGLAKQMDATVRTTSPPGTVVQLRFFPSTHRRASPA